MIYFYPENYQYLKRRAIICTSYSIIVKWMWVSVMVGKKKKSEVGHSESDEVPRLSKHPEG